MARVNIIDIIKKKLKNFLNWNKARTQKSFIRKLKINRFRLKKLIINPKKLAYASISDAASSIPADDFYKTGSSINIKLRYKADDQNI